MSDTSSIAAVALYAGLNGLILLWLGMKIGKMRLELGVSVGDGGHAVMVRAMRGQANFIEFVPMSLILLFAMAFLGAPVWVLHLFGVMLTAGRLLHAMHFLAPDAPRWQRGAGFMLSAAVLGFGSIGVIGHALVNL